MAVVPDTTISIVGNVGRQAFSPNPITVAVNQRVVFRNDDSRTHRIVADAGGFDSGNVAPGASSAPITITSGNPMPFHCTIHPSMVGAINTASSSGGGSGDPEPSPGYRRGAPNPIARQSLISIFDARTLPSGCVVPFTSSLVPILI